MRGDPIEVFFPFEQNAQEPAFALRRADVFRRGFFGFFCLNSLRARAFFEVAANGLRWHSEAQRCFLRIGVADNVADGFLNCFGHCLNDGSATSVSCRVVQDAKAIQVIIEKVASLFDQLRKRRTAKFLDETVRIMGRWHRRERGRPGRKPSTMSSERTAAFCPALSESKQSTTSST